MNAQIHFTPQAWIRDYAHEVDAEGDTDFEIPADFHGLWYPIRWADGTEYGEPGMIVQDNSYESDDLRHHPNAPEWIRDWHGPFEVEITNREELEAYAHEVLPARSH